MSAQHERRQPDCRQPSRPRRAYEVRLRQRYVGKPLEDGAITLPRRLASVQGNAGLLVEVVDRVVHDDDVQSLRGCIKILKRHGLYPRVRQHEFASQFVKAFARARSCTSFLGLQADDLTDTGERGLKTASANAAPRRGLGGHGT